MSDGENKETRHQAAPENLWASEIRYRRLFESARDGILLLDAVSRKITDVNPFMVEFLGYSRDEFLGKELWEIGLFKDQDESRAAFRELQTTGYIRYEDLPLQTKTGKQWNVEFVSNVYRENSHQVIQCNIRDITERKSTEERLKQNEQWLRTIFDASQEGILVEDNERIHYVNKSYLQLFGYDEPEELIGRHISAVIAPEDAERLLGFGRSRLRGEQPPSEYEFKGRRKDGSTVDVEASASATNIAGSHYITTMIRDITERKRAEAALSDTRERLLQAMDAAKMFSWEMNPRTQEFSFSSNVERTIGFTFPTEIIDNPIGNHIHPEDVEQAVGNTLRALETGEPYEDTMRMINPHTGEIVWMHSQGVIVNNAEGDARFVGIAQNITERKHIEILLDTQKKALEMVVSGSPLAEVLEYLAGIVEGQSEGSSIASILLLDDEGRLHNGAAPSLPDDYLQAIEGIKADENVGTCSAAAATSTTIVSPDIATDPKWRDLKHLPLGLNLLAAWSMPIVAADGRVLGTFGTYFREKREPTKLERQTVEILAKTAALAIERRQAEEALRRLNEQLEQRVAERTVALVGMNDSLQAEMVERRRAERERASILRRLVMAQEEERRRVARDMHDQFGQQLTVLLLKLGMLKQDCGGQKGLREQVENLEEVAGQLDADVDFLVWELRPTALDDLGLQDALTNFAQNWSKHCRVPVEVLTRGLGEEASTSEIDTTLYRIAQEALNNVAKHARAASVTVILEGRADAVSLIIEDDGVGFDAEHTSGANDKGLGLVGMRERAALVGGTAEVESQPGEGTRVIVRIPTPPRAQRQGAAHE